MCIIFSCECAKYGKIIQKRIIARSANFINCLGNSKWTERRYIVWSTKRSTWKCLISWPYLRSSIVWCKYVSVEVFFGSKSAGFDYYTVRGYYPIKSKRNITIELCVILLFLNLLESARKKVLFSSRQHEFLS